MYVVAKALSEMSVLFARVYFYTRHLECFMILLYFVFRFGKKLEEISGDLSFVALAFSAANMTTEYFMFCPKV